MASDALWLVILGHARALGRPFRAAEMVEWVQTQHPMYRPNSVRTQLRDMSINVSPPSMHPTFAARNAHNRLLYRVAPGVYELYESARHGASKDGVLIDPTFDDEPAWDIDVGETVPRSELDDRWGGDVVGKIGLADRARSIFLFHAPDAGSDYAEHLRGWQPDGTFHFLGEGQVGDQLPTRGANKVLLDAPVLNRPVRLFIDEGDAVTYVGEMALAGDSPYFRTDSMDGEGEFRSVLVFRLVPVGPVHRSDTRDERRLDPVVMDLPLEANDVEAYVIARPDEPQVSVRREAALVRAYGVWLGTQGRRAQRHRILLPDGRSLYTDCYDESYQEVLEAKGSAARTHVRSGLGQILDYSRYVDHERRALLLPTRPADDLIQLLAAHGVGVVWQDGIAFQRLDPTSGS